MPTTLPGLGTISYDGVILDGPKTLSSVRARPEYDEAGRTVKWVVYEVLIQTTIHTDGSTTTDTSLTEIRNKLSKPGGAFVFTGQGFGDLSVNVSAGGPRDVAWGPKPKILQWQDVAGGAAGNAADVVWMVEVAIPQGSGAKYEKFPAAFNYIAEYTFDDAFNTELTYAGFIEIPMTRKGIDNVSLADHCDFYRDKLKMVHPDGFRLKGGMKFRDNAAKNRLDFAMTFEELPTPYPRGVIWADGRHKLSGTGAVIKGGQWTNTISATFEPAKGKTNADMIAAFMDLLKQRAPKKAVFRSFDMERPLWGPQSRRVMFSCSYTVTGKLADVAKNCAFFDPPPAPSFKDWKESVKSTTGVRGRAGLKPKLADDAIIDLLHTNDLSVSGPGVVEDALKRFGDPKPPVTDPPKDDSWLEYEVTARTYTDTPAIVHQGLAENNQGAGAGVSIVGSALIAIDQIIAAAGKTIQEHPNPSVKAVLRVRAKRVGFKIMRPTLISIGGVKALNETVILDESRGTEIDVFGRPIYSKLFRMEYELACTDPPETNNIILGVFGPDGKTSLGDGELAADAKRTAGQDKA